MLQPDFDSIPMELKQRKNWVLWKESDGKKKVPLNEKGHKTDVTKKAAGMSFEVAHQAYITKGNVFGVGVILNADGLVCVDIDNCITDGNPNPTALNIIYELGGGYIEISPSGNGLHVWGYSDEIFSGSTGKIKDQKVEIYCQDRYITVTGIVPSFISGDISALPGLGDLLRTIGKKHRAPQESQEQHDFQEVQDLQDIHESQELQASGGVNHQQLDFSDFNWDNLPNRAIPTEYGQRNNVIFEFARYIIGVHKNFAPHVFKPLVTEWFSRYCHNIETKDFEVTWIEFLYAYDKVVHPYGETLQDIASQAIELPDFYISHDLGELGNKTLKICLNLALHHGNNQFFLSGRSLSTIIGIGHQQCNKLLSILVKSGYLKLIEKGHTGRASTYLMAHTLVKTMEEQL